MEAPFFILLPSVFKQSLHTESCLVRRQYDRPSIIQSDFKTNGRIRSTISFTCNYVGSQRNLTYQFSAKSSVSLTFLSKVKLEISPFLKLHHNSRTYKFHFWQSSAGCQRGVRRSTFNQMVNLLGIFQG